MLPGSVLATLPRLDVSDLADGVPDIALMLLALASAVIVALLVAALLRSVARVAGRRWPLLNQLSHRARQPLRLLLVTVSVWIAIALTTEPASWTSMFEHGMFILVLVEVAWLLVQITVVVADGIAARYPVDVPDNRHARRVHTQLQLLRRLVSATIVLVVAAVILLTFPGMKAVGASILASAGIVSIVAGLAAQTSLANVFAGMQIAFTDAVRVDDVVVVEGEWGRIEEITLTYVVVHVWDDRRLVLPSTYFTTTPFQNWTRKTSELLGSVEMDVDWTVSVDGMRAELDRLLLQTELWDGRVANIQVTEATGGHVRIRALASAGSGPELWDLRCYLREGLVSWLQLADTGLPRTRLEPAGRRRTAIAPVEPVEVGAGRGAGAGDTDDLPRMSGDTTGLFHGTAEAERRSQSFAGPIREGSDHTTGTIRRLAAQDRERAEGGGTHGDT